MGILGAVSEVCLQREYKVEFSKNDLAFDTHQVSKDRCEEESLLLVEFLLHIWPVEELIDQMFSKFEYSRENVPQWKMEIVLRWKPVCTSSGNVV